MSKVHINVGTIGHVDHGKTTLTAAILATQARKGLAKVKSYADIAKGGTVRDENKTVTIAVSHVEYESDNRHFAHIDCPGHADYIKNMITGAAQMDGAILLVDGSQGPQQQTREHILLARQVGVGSMVVFINKVDISDPELLEIVELEVVEALEAQGYKDSPIVKGSALLALRGEDDVCISQLVEALDTYIPVPKRDMDSPFMMPIESVHTILGRGTVVTGRIERGVLNRGDAIEILGLSDDNKARQVVVTGIQAFHKDQEQAQAGENCGLLLRGVKKEEVVRGQVIAAPGSIQTHTKIQAELFAIPKDEGGRHTPFFPGYQPQFFIGTTDVTGKIETIGQDGGGKMVMPGDHAQVGINFLKPVGIETGMRFAVREGSRTVGAGVVLSVG